MADSKLNDGEKRRAAKLAHDLASGFRWAETPEGDAYWRQVNWALTALSAGAVPEPSTPEPHSREAMHAAAEAVNLAFTWSATVEGAEYWGEVYRRLRAHGAGNPLQVPVTAPQGDALTRAIAEHGLAKRLSEYAHHGAPMRNRP